LAVSVKVCKHAVGRNRLKRLVRESFRLHQAALGEGGGLDFVVLPSHRAVAENNQVLTNSLARHWEEAGAIVAGGLPLNNKGSIHHDG
jgi:ribonuclease P protein component